MMSQTTSPGLGPTTTSDGTLYGAAGLSPRPLPQAAARSSGVQVGDFVQQQPMTAALIALVVGYFIGKLT
jgi:hypothetical protein